MDTTTVNTPTLFDLIMDEDSIVVMFVDDPGIYRVHEGKYYFYSLFFKSWTESTIFKPGVHVPVIYATNFSFDGKIPDTCTDMWLKNIRSRIANTLGCRPKAVTHIEAD